ncbi:hint-domain-containing protein [Podospora australis]|uniref:Hint-domain-containing protein n=1 Tax=Podospora australis TaxID=1536484 RepID=A0AAN6WSL2_9PEZI|nr:hint-domain-containing protein [Podospora australis]
MVLVSLFGNGKQYAEDKDSQDLAETAEKLLSLGPRSGGDSSTKKSLVQIHPFNTEDGLLIKIEPPREPEDSKLSHVPLDLVLCIDVSGSMGADAPVPGNGDDDHPEHTGLSVLDLVKHAAKTILETMDSRDRLGIVTFAGKSKVLQKLTATTVCNKKSITDKIDEMRPLDMTNLWHGIRDSLKLFEETDGSYGRVPVVLVLTDGLPNHMCPIRGYVPQLRSMERLPATIHTFGFGYSLRSGLLKSIAEIGGGNYSFIPDAGMIGTVFVHAVANLQSTFATNATLRITYPAYLQLQETTGEAVEKTPAIEMEGDVLDLHQLTISLSNLQYGQSRDIYLRYGGVQGKALRRAAATGAPPIVTASLEYTHHSSPPWPTPSRIVAYRSVLDHSTTLSEAQKAYHISRSHLVAFLSTMYPLNRVDEEHESIRYIQEDILTGKALRTTLLESLPCRHFLSDPDCASLLHDLVSKDLSLLESDTTKSWTGQITLALTNDTYFFRWGKHYLPSLAGAHSRQVCNTFKDPGPLRYGSSSPLFIKCRDKLNEAFDALPAPEPSNVGSRYYYHRYRPANSSSLHCPPPAYGIHDGVRGVVSMADYNNAGGSCFASFVPVTLASGAKLPISKLRRGMQVTTPTGTTRVLAVMRTQVRKARMSLLPGGVMATPWHPILVPGTENQKWCFPKQIEEKKVIYTGAIYSVILEKGGDADGHALLLGGGRGLWGVTMGHGMTEYVAASQEKDVRVHEFFGYHDKVCKAIRQLHGTRNGLMLGGGVTRDRTTGLINGFKRASEAQGRRMVTARGQIGARVKGGEMKRRKGEL